MSLKSLIRKPLAIALLGAASVGVPVSAPVLVLKVAHGGLF